MENKYGKQDDDDDDGGGEGAEGIGGGRKVISFLTLTHMHHQAIIVIVFNPWRGFKSDTFKYSHCVSNKYYGDF